MVLTAEYFKSVFFTLFVTFVADFEKIDTICGTVSKKILVQVIQIFCILLIRADEILFRYFAKFSRKQGLK